MADVISSPPVANIKKRPAPEDESPEKQPLNLRGSQFMMPTPPDTDNSSNASPENNNNTAKQDNQKREASPAPSTSTISTLSSTTENLSNTPGPSTATATGSTIPPINSGPPPAKRRKLTPAEKLEKAQAKEAKEREKAEQKARKEEEKRAKEEEKRIKDQEKREAQQAKDEEKRRKAEEKEAKQREKDLQEERKAQEKLKRERSQMRLGAFFQQKPASPAQVNDSEEGYIKARRRSLSLELYDEVADKIKAASPAKGTPPPATEKKAATNDSPPSDYSRTFLPFVVQSHSSLAPTPAACESAQSAFDQEIKDPSLREQYDLGLVKSYQGHADIDHYFANERELARGIQCPNLRELVDTIHGTSQQPIDLTHDGSAETAMDRLRKVPVKHIQFEQDVRPPYFGTWTKIRSPGKIRKVRVKPFTRVRPDTNYDYDSEAEWEEPEEGDEEVLSEDEDEADSQADADDIDGFLDDEDDAGKNKRKIIIGELVPESSGLCWADPAGRISVVENIEVPHQPQEMRGMSMGILLPGFEGPTIDPFDTTYWDAATSNTQAPDLSVNDESVGAMGPPRIPLQPRPNSSTAPKNDLIGAAEGQKGPITSVYASQAAKRGPKPAPKTLSQEDLAKFKEAVIGSQVGKLDLQKGLKTRFPKWTNEVIKETLSSQFAQVGKGKADKRWVFVGDQ